MIHLKMRKTGAPFNAGGEEGGPREGKVADQERRGPVEGRVSNRRDLSAEAGFTGDL